MAEIHRLPQYHPPEADESPGATGQAQTRLPLQARPPAKQGEAAWGTSGQVTQKEKGALSGRP